MFDSIFNQKDSNYISLKTSAAYEKENIDKAKINISYFWFALLFVGFLLIVYFDNVYFNRIVWFGYLIPCAGWFLYSIFKLFSSGISQKKLLLLEQKVKYFSLVDYLGKYEPLVDEINEVIGYKYITNDHIIHLKKVNDIVASNYSLIPASLSIIPCKGINGTVHNKILSDYVIFLSAGALKLPTNELAALLSLGYSRYTYHSKNLFDDYSSLISSYIEPVFKFKHLNIFIQMFCFPKLINGKIISYFLDKNLKNKFGEIDSNVIDHLGNDSFCKLIERNIGNSTDLGCGDITFEPFLFFQSKKNENFIYSVSNKSRLKFIHENYVFNNENNIDIPNKKYQECKNKFFILPTYDEYPTLESYLEHHLEKSENIEHIELKSIYEFNVEKGNSLNVSPFYAEELEQQKIDRNKGVEDKKVIKEEQNTKKTKSQYRLLSEKDHKSSISQDLKNNTQTEIDNKYQKKQIKTTKNDEQKDLCILSSKEVVNVDFGLLNEKFISASLNNLTEKVLSNVHSIHDVYTVMDNTGSNFFMKAYSTLPDSINSSLYEPSNFIECCCRMILLTDFGIENTVYNGNTLKIEWFVPMFTSCIEVLKEYGKDQLQQLKNSLWSNYSKTKYVGTSFLFFFAAISYVEERFEEPTTPTKDAVVSSIVKILNWSLKQCKYELVDVSNLVQNLNQFFCANITDEDLKAEINCGEVLFALKTIRNTSKSLKEKVLEEVEKTLFVDDQLTIGEVNFYHVLLLLINSMHHA